MSGRVLFASVGAALPPGDAGQLDHDPFDRHAGHLRATRRFLYCDLPLCRVGCLPEHLMGLAFRSGGEQRDVAASTTFVCCLLLPRQSQRRRRPRRLVFLLPLAVVLAIQKTSLPLLCARTHTTRLRASAHAQTKPARDREKGLDIAKSIITRVSAKTKNDDPVRRPPGPRGSLAPFWRARLDPTLPSRVRRHGLGP